VQIYRGICGCLCPSHRNARGMKLCRDARDLLRRAAGVACPAHALRQVAPAAHYGTGIGASIRGGRFRCFRGARPA
jgi:hypothetical protein